MKKSYLELGATAVIFASFGIFARLLADSFTNIGQTLTRSLVAFLIIFAIVLYRKVNLTLKRSSLLIIFLLSFAVASSMYLFTLSINEMKISSAIFLLYAGSISGSIVFGKVFFKEKLSKLKISVLLLTLVGLYIFASPINLNSLYLLLIGIGSGVFDVAGNSIRKLLKDLSKLTLLFYQYFFTLVIFLTATILNRDLIFNTFNSNSILIIVFGGLILLSNWILNKAFRNVDLTIGTIILSLEVLASIVFGFIFFQEVPDLNEIVGGILIFASFLLLNIKSKN